MNHAEYMIIMLDLLDNIPGAIVEIATEDSLSYKRVFGFGS